MAGSHAFGCFSSCNFDDTIAPGKTLPAGNYLVSVNLDVLVGNTFTPANSQGGVTCFIGSPGTSTPTFLVALPATGFMVEGGSAHVFLTSTLNVATPTAVGVYCPDTFTLYGLTGSASLTATTVANIH